LGCGEGAHGPGRGRGAGRLVERGSDDERAPRECTAFREAALQLRPLDRGTVLGGRHRLAGIGSEHEDTGEILHLGDFAAQLRYAYAKLKRVLARNGAGMADVVKQVTYVTDMRYSREASALRREAYGDAPLPAHTFLNVSQLAWPGMLVEIDVIAITDASMRQPDPDP
jgi:enamine deaminase RidA (YjgF/YER057c/UK114 family)